jgi:transcriptional regulator with XRE-family HTH domain
VADVLRARAQFGNHLRRTRQQAGLTGKQLADSLGWAASKISRLENGRQTATRSDVTAWSRGVSASDRTREELLDELYALRVEYEGWQRRIRRGHAALQAQAQKLMERATVIRVFQPAMIPGLLQTAAYARAVLHASILLNDTVNDVEDAVRSRLRWQHLLYESDRRFVFIVTETALRRRIATVGVHREALDRLKTLSSLESVRIEVVPDVGRASLPPSHSFWVYDEKLVQIETLTGSVSLREPDDVEVYLRVFASLGEAAATGQELDAVLSRIAHEED